MKMFLLIALFGATCVATSAFADDQDVVTLQDVVVQALQAAPTPPATPARQTPSPRPATAGAPAQAPAPPGAATPVPPVPPFPPQPAPAGVAARPTANVRFDVTITDTGGAKPVTKTLSLTVTPGNSSASIRSSARTTPDGPGTLQVGAGPILIAPPTTVSLNVDVRGVSWVETNAVRASVTVEYQPYVPDAKIQPGVVTATATSAFFDGRRIQILSTADPISDRKTTIEVTATILK